MLPSGPESGEAKTLHYLKEFDEGDGQRRKYQQSFRRSGENMMDAALVGKIDLTCLGFKVLGHV